MIFLWELESLIFPCFPSPCHYRQNVFSLYGCHSLGDRLWLAQVSGNQVTLPRAGGWWGVDSIQNDMEAGEKWLVVWINYSCYFANLGLNIYSRFVFFFLMYCRGQSILKIRLAGLERPYSYIYHLCVCDGMLVLGQTALILSLPLSYSGLHHRGSRCWMPIVQPPMIAWFTNKQHLWETTGWMECRNMVLLSSFVSSDVI